MAGLFRLISSASSTSATSVMRSAPRSNAMAAVVNARNTSMTKRGAARFVGVPRQAANPYFPCFIVVPPD